MAVRGRAQRAIRAIVIAPRVAIFAGFVWAGALEAQSPVLQRADSAWRSGDRALARQLYSEILAADSSQSRAVYRLAQTEESPRRALALYRRYAQLEPNDAWGHMAVGDACSKLGDLREAMAAYDRAERLAPDERDVAIGRARALSRAGRSDAAATVLAQWLDRHADDAEAWELLSRERLRAGRPRQAAQAAERAGSLRESPTAASLLRTARAQNGPTLAPTAGYQHDSDGNDARRIGLFAEVAVADGVRLGVSGQQGALEGVAESQTPTPAPPVPGPPVPGPRPTSSMSRVDVLEGSGYLALRPRSDMHLRFQGGLVRLTGDDAGLWVTPFGEARFRRRGSTGPNVDLRVQGAPLAVSPLLVANRAARVEARGTLELPAGALRIRPGGRIGSVSANGEPSNARTGWDLALAIPLGWQGEISGQYHRLSYASPSAAGYFAPRLVETREAAGYFERETDGGLTLAADVGAGVQRVAEHGAGMGTWERALRGWASMSIPVSAGWVLWSEAEAYDSPFAPEGVSTSASWRFLSLSIGLRWMLQASNGR